MNLLSLAEMDGNVCINGHGASVLADTLASDITKPTSFWGDLSASVEGKGKIPVPYGNVGCPLLKRQLENFPGLSQTQGPLKTSSPR